MGFAAMTSGSAGFIKRFREMRVGEYRNPHLIHERYRQNADRIPEPDKENYGRNKSKNALYLKITVDKGRIKIKWWVLTGSNRRPID